MKMLEVLHIFYLDIGSRLYYIKKLINKLNFNVVIVGYRGYGRSEGYPTEKGLMLDGEAIIKYTFDELKQDFDIDLTKWSLIEAPTKNNAKKKENFKIIKVILLLKTAFYEI